MLVAVGRGPHTEGLGYAEAGITLDRGFVSVDERLQTSVPGVYAVGDIVAGLQLAHRGFAHGIFVAEEIAHSSAAGINHRCRSSIETSRGSPIPTRRSLRWGLPRRRPKLSSAPSRR